MGSRTPIVSWRYLAFEHNEHEIDDAIAMAQQLGVDEFVLATPFDVSWDDPNIRPSRREGRVIEFCSDHGIRMTENWNPFPSDIDAERIEEAFAADWQQRCATVGNSAADDHQASSRHTCHYLYKNITMDATGRILPCCGAPRPNRDLLFGTAQSGTDVFNSEKYRLARLSFANPELYRIQQDSAGLANSPHCAICDWNQDHAQIDNENLRNYFRAAGRAVFTSASISVLSSW